MKEAGDEWREYPVLTVDLIGCSSHVVLSSMPNTAVELFQQQCNIPLTECDSTSLPLHFESVLKKGGSCVNGWMDGSI